MITESSLTRHAKSEDGFTLVELLVVISIMGIIFSLGAFALQQYLRAQALTGATNTVLTDLRDTQVRAQAEVRLMRLVFDVDAESYTMERHDGTDWQVLETKSLDRGVDLETASFATFGGCPSGAVTPSNELYFCARGVSSQGSVVLRSLRLNQDREISVIGLTSRAEVR